MRAPKITISFILLAFSPYSIADMLVSDQQSFYQKYYENLTRTIEAAQKLVVENAQLVGIGTAAETQVEAINNGFSNTVARLDKGKEERQNLEQLERSQPAKDACDTLTISSGLNDAACSEVGQTEKLSSDRLQRYSVATGGGIMNTTAEITVQDVNAENTQAAMVIMDKCAQLNGKCQDPKLWLSGSALTVDEYKALQLQNDLAANVKIAVPQVTGLDPSSPEHARAVLEDVRRENAREQARANLEALQIAQHGTLSDDGTRAPGRVELYDDYDDKRLNSKDWICATTNSCGDSYVPPAEAQRRSAEMKAVELSLALDQYKSNLRREALLQSALLHSINDNKPQQQ